MQTLKSEISAVEGQIKTLEEALDQTETKRDAVELEYTKANDELNKNREKLKACDEQSSALIKEQAVRKQELTDCLLDQKRLVNEVKRRQKDQQESGKTRWIASNKQLFNKPGTNFDFSTHDFNSARQERLGGLQTEQKNIEKRVNKKAEAMFVRAEKDYIDLMDKRRIVEADKAKIQKGIHELDEKK